MVPGHVSHELIAGTVFEAQLIMLLGCVVDEIWQK